MHRSITDQNSRDKRISRGFTRMNADQENVKPGSMDRELGTADLKAKRQPNTKTQLILYFTVLGSRFTIPLLKV